MGSAALTTGHRPSLGRPAIRAAVGSLLALLVIVGCDGAADESPTADQTARPTSTSAGTSSPPASPTRAPRPTSPPWPAGWDEGFCSALAETVISMELVVDVPRALDEGATDDALGLARELRDTAPAAAELVAAVEEWDTAQPTLGQLVAVLDVAERIGRQYTRYLEDQRNASLERATELSEDISALVADTNEELAALAATGVDCPPNALALESP